MPSGRRRIGKVSRRVFLIDSIWVVQEREGLTRVIRAFIIIINSNHSLLQCTLKPQVFQVSIGEEFFPLPASFARSIRI